jgi:protein-disulfide isomerase
MLRRAAPAIGIWLALLAGCQARESNCAKFVSEVCRAAGETSRTCGDVKAVTEVLSPAACGALDRDVDHALRQLADRDEDCVRLETKLCAELGKGACQTAKEQIRAFPAERCSAMLERYPEVAAELRRIYQGHQGFIDAHRPEALARVPGFGPVDAKVTLIEFSDFESDGCARGSPLATHIRNVYGDRVRFVFRQFPLGPHAHLAAEASLAAQAQGKFWEFHDLVFSNQHDLTRAALERYAQAAGLDLAQFRQALDRGEFAAEVDRDHELGKQALVTEVPALFVNGKHVKFPFDVAALSELMDQALAAK